MSSPRRAQPYGNSSRQVGNMGVTGGIMHNIRATALSGGGGLRLQLCRCGEGPDGCCLALFGPRLDEALIGCRTNTSRPVLTFQVSAAERRQLRPGIAHAGLSIPNHAPGLYKSNAENNRASLLFISPPFVHVAMHDNVGASSASGAAAGPFPP